MASKCNVPSRTLFMGDNLDILRGINSECVDLIYLNPPWNSGYRLVARETSRARGVAFDDEWTQDHIEAEWLEEVELRCPAAFQVINSAKIASGDRMAHYLTFMGIRLLELERVLKPTGSIYLHCDPKASHYLKIVMDAVFGEDNFKSEVVWYRGGSRGGLRTWGPNHSTLLFYTGLVRHRWNRVPMDYDPEYWMQYFTYEDERGRFRTVSLMGEGMRGHLSTDWRGVNPADIGRHWAVPLRSLRNAYPNRDDLDGLSPQQKLDLLDDAGLIYWPTRGRVPRHKQYADQSEGARVQDVITNILNMTRTESTGWPRQMPVRLVDLIIRVSSNPGDLVLDPFCGSGTTCIAAENLGRDWIGIEQVYEAEKVLHDRLEHELDNSWPADEGDWQLSVKRYMPIRTDIKGSESRIDLRVTRQLLHARQSGRCNGCEHSAPLHFLTIDRVDPAESEADVANPDKLQLLCHACKTLKGNHNMDYLKLQLYMSGILRN